MPWLDADDEIHLMALHASKSARAANFQGTAIINLVIEQFVSEWNNHPDPQNQITQNQITVHGSGFWECLMPEILQIVLCKTLSGPSRIQITDYIIL